MTLSSTRKTTQNLLQAFASQASLANSTFEQQLTSYLGSRNSTSRTSRRNNTIKNNRSSSTSRSTQFQITTPRSQTSGKCRTRNRSCTNFKPITPAPQTKYMGLQHFVNEVLFFDLMKYSTMLAPFNQVYHQVDVRKQGCIDHEQVFELFHLLASPRLPRNHQARVLKFIEQIDPSGTGFVTYFQIVHALSNNLQRDWDGLVTSSDPKTATDKQRRATVMCMFLDHFN